MFRHELTVGTALQFVALVTVKCLHHVATQREQNLRMTQDAVQEGGRFPYICTGHLRVILFLCFLQAVDMMVVQYAAAEIFKSGPSVQILFAFEAAILLVSAWSHMVLWHLHVIDSVISYGHEHEWHFTSKLLHPWKDYKATLTFVVELQAQAVNFLFYSTFFAIVMTFYGPPLNLFREVYMSLAKLKERLTAFFNYRHLMASMNRFASATDEQLDEVGRTCIICRDEMCTTDCKRLPVCAHTFHKSCLREWLVQPPWKLKKRLETPRRKQPKSEQRQVPLQPTNRCQEQEQPGRLRQTRNRALLRTQQHPPHRAILSLRIRYS
jgi:E3 ubiquitin-protein ligase synoviolin